MDKGGSVDKASLSLKRIHGGDLGGGAPLGNLEDVFRRFPDTDLSLREGPFSVEGNLVCGGGRARILGTLIDERRRALVMGHHSARDSIRGPGGRAPLLVNPKDEVFERYAKCHVDGPLCLCTGPVGEPGGGSFVGTFGRHGKYIRV